MNMLLWQGCKTRLLSPFGTSTGPNTEAPERAKLEMHASVPTSPHPLNSKHL
jgi:hypothetical protein